MLGVGIDKNVFNHMKKLFVTFLNPFHFGNNDSRQGRTLIYFSSLIKIKYDFRVGDVV